MKMLKLAAAVVAITAAALSQTVTGQTPSTSVVITFTEFSSISLTAVYTDPLGVTLPLNVNNTSADNWTVSLPTFLITATANQWLPWAEPELVSPIRGNIVSPSGTNSFAVSSDVAISGFVDNGDFSSTWIAYDTRGASAVPVFGRFIDLGDASAAVPDTGSTMMLLGIGVAGLGWIRRKLC